MITRPRSRKPPTKCAWTACFQSYERHSVSFFAQYFLGAAQPRANRSRQDIANCELQNANCKLFELPSSNLQFAIVILQFAFLFGHSSSLTSGLRAKPALPLTRPAVIHLQFQ